MGPLWHKTGQTACVRLLLCICAFLSIMEGGGTTNKAGRVSGECVHGTADRVALRKIWLAREFRWDD